MSLRENNWLQAIAVGALFSFGVAHAAETGDDPSRPRTGPSAQPQATPDYATPTTPQLATPAPSAASPASDSTDFVLRDVSVQAGGGAAPMQSAWKPDPQSGLSRGASGKLDAEWVRAQFQGKIGDRIRVDEIAAIIQQINVAFVQNGYVNSGVRLADLPSGEGGALKLNLIYGRLVGATDKDAPIQVTWANGKRKGLTPTFVRQRLPSAFSEPFNATRLETDFRILAEDPAIARINGGLSPTGVAGQARLNLEVTPQARYDAYLTIANSRSPSVGGERFAIGGSIRNVLFAGDVVAGEAGVTKGLSDYSVSYQTPFLSPRNTFDIRADSNDANVVDPALRKLDIQSNGWSVEGGLTRTLFERPLTPKLDGKGWRSARVVSVGVRVGHKETESFLLGTPFSFSPGAVDGVSKNTTARLTAQWEERGESKVWVASVTTNFGLEGTGSDVPGVSVPDPNFQTALIQINHARRLPFAKLELRARLAGQWASGLLYSSERFSAGGEGTVRGYSENLLLADSGILGSVELVRAFNFSQNREGFRWGSFQGSVFVDGASLRNEEGAQPNPMSISSVGATIAWTPTEALTAKLSYGAALNDVPFKSDDIQDEGIHFRVVCRPLKWF